MRAEDLELIAPDAEAADALAHLLDMLTPEQRGALVRLLLPKGGLPLVDALMAHAGDLDGTSFDELRSRLGQLADLDYDWTPEGGLITRWPGGQYSVSNATLAPPESAQYHAYPEALAALRALLGDDTEAPVNYLNLSTGLQLDLPPIGEIREDWDRDTSGLYPEFWAHSAGAVSTEAFCSLCGEIVNPTGADEMVHNVRADGEHCGGLLVPVGWWH